MWFCYCIGNTVVFILTHKFYFGLFFFFPVLSPIPLGEGQWCSATTIFLLIFGLYLDHVRPKS